MIVVQVKVIIHRDLVVIRTMDQVVEVIVEIQVQEEDSSEDTLIHLEPLDMVDILVHGLLI